MTRSLYPLLLSVSLMLPVAAYCEQSDVDTMLQEMEKQLQISKDRFEAMRPELRSALESKSEALSKDFDAALAQGLIELEKMGNSYSEATSEAAARLDELMRSEEMDELRSYLSQLDEEAIRKARDQMVQQFIDVLQLTGEQIAAMKPILEDKLENLGRILERYKDAGKSGLEQFRKEFEAETQNGIDHVERILSPPQMEKFEQQLDAIQDTIQTQVLEV